MVDLKNQNSEKVKSSVGEEDMLIESIGLLKQMELIDTKEALQKVKQKIEVRKSRKWMLILQRVAAVIVLPLLFFVVWQNKQITSFNQQVAEHQISTPPTLRSTFELPDGTQIWMNGNTTIHYPEKFVGKERMISLEGEAYFKVAKNMQQPFVVKINDLLVEAIGTEFNISTYSDETMQEVLLTEGSVKLLLEKNDQRIPLIDMKVNEFVTFDRVNRKMNVRVVDPEKYIAWKDGKIIFKNDNLNDVMKKLERWYNIDFVYSLGTMHDYAFTGTFSGEDINQILKCIEITTPIHFKIQEPKKNNNNEYQKTRIEIMNSK